MLVPFSSLCCWLQWEPTWKGTAVFHAKINGNSWGWGTGEKYGSRYCEGVEHPCSDYYTREKIFLCSSARRHQECEWWLCVAFLDCVLKRPPSLRCLCTIVTEIAAALNLEMEAPPWGCQSTTASWAAFLWDSYVSKKQTCHILELGDVQNLLATASQILRKWCIFCYSPVKFEVLN